MNNSPLSHLCTYTCMDLHTVSEYMDTVELVVLSLSSYRCWCSSCNPSKLEVFEEDHCAVHEPCASVANCSLVWEVAGGVSLVP